MGDYMTLSKFKYNKYIILVMIMAIISILSIKSASILLNYKYNLMYKQISWYIIGFIITFIVYKVGNNKIYKNIWILYIIGNILLLLLLLLANPVNNSKCWFDLKIFTIQPSEFMKIILIILISIMTNKFNNNYTKHNLKNEFIFIIKILLILLIPSILTFLEPDTGAVIIYFIIAFTILFISGIRYRWFILLGILISLSIIGLIILYKFNNDLFINIFGTSLFMRIDRLLDWSIKDGYQLNNSIAAIGSAGLLGSGFNHTPIYFPEADTDFIFAVFSSNKGFIGSMILIIVITIFDIMLIKLAFKTKSTLSKYIIAGITGMLIYGQFQNIGMTYGIIPITGITLPFISYGGSSLISYMIILGIIINIEKKCT